MNKGKNKIWRQMIATIVEQKKQMEQQQDYSSINQPNKNNKEVIPK